MTVVMLIVSLQILLFVVCRRKKVTVFPPQLVDFHINIVLHHYRERLPYTRHLVIRLLTMAVVVHSPPPVPLAQSHQTT